QLDLAAGEIDLLLRLRLHELVLCGLAGDRVEASVVGDLRHGVRIAAIAVALRDAPNVRCPRDLLDRHAIALTDLPLVRHDPDRGSIEHRDRVAHASPVALSGTGQGRTGTRAQNRVAR